MQSEALELSTDRGLQLVAYAAEPATPSSDGLRMLGSWAVTVANRDAAGPVGKSLDQCHGGPAA